MRLIDSRRLTGPNLMLGSFAVIAEVAFEPHEEPLHAITIWERELAKMATSLGLPPYETIVRHYTGCAALVFTAPLDLLMPATDINEHAVASATEILAGRPGIPLEPKKTELAKAIAEAKNPRLLALRAGAVLQQIPLLLDDKLVTLGSGRHSITWPRDQVPPIEEIPWADVDSVPVALITGTNGKTTSARLVARIAREAGFNVGSTSTDGVAINGQFVEEGDYTGPAGALAVLRRPEIQLAVLETARGGILRRGLGIERCEAALITNVSHDHLGDYGIEDLETMGRVKAVTGSIAKTVVLNGADPTLMKLVSLFSGKRVIYFAIDRAPGDECWYVSHGMITRSRGTERTVLMSVDEVPLTFGGRATYNIENALGAAALASALGIKDEAIKRGLSQFTSSPTDNPGRGNMADANGVRVLVDFGHNAVAVNRVLAFARKLVGPGNVSVIFGMPGDRLDEEMREVARQIALAAPARVVLRELNDYLRGRQPGAVPKLLREALLAAGVREDQVELAPLEVDALASLLDRAKPGELVAILPSVETEAVRALLDARSAKWL
jgi:UDP-N-acetylmuramyl tripeptide synthase